MKKFILTLLITLALFTACGKDNHSTSDDFDHEAYEEAQTIEQNKDETIEALEKIAEVPVTKDDITSNTALTTLIAEDPSTSGFSPDEAESDEGLQELKAIVNLLDTNEIEVEPKAINDKEVTLTYTISRQSTVSSSTISRVVATSSPTEFIQKYEFKGDGTVDVYESNYSDNSWYLANVALSPQDVQKSLPEFLLGKRNDLKNLYNISGIKMLSNPTNSYDALFQVGSTIYYIFNYKGTSWNVYTKDGDFDLTAYQKSVTRRTITDNGLVDSDTKVLNKVKIINEFSKNLIEISDNNIESELTKLIQEKNQASDLNDVQLQTIKQLELLMKSNANYLLSMTEEFPDTKIDGYKSEFTMIDFGFQFLDEIEEGKKVIIEIEFNTLKNKFSYTENMYVDETKVKSGLSEFTVNKDGSILCKVNDIFLQTELSKTFSGLDLEFYYNMGLIDLIISNLNDNVNSVISATSVTSDIYYSPVATAYPYYLCAFDNYGYFVYFETNGDVKILKNTEFDRKTYTKEGIVEGEGWKTELPLVDTIKAHFTDITSDVNPRLTINNLADSFKIYFESEFKNNSL